MSGTEAQTGSNADATEPRNRYRPEIDGLRAFAVCAVIINHFRKDLLTSGYLGVDIFFVISGYVITASLAARPATSLPALLAGFYERRIKRLLPALVLFVLVTSLAICLFNPDPQLALETGRYSLFGLSNLFLLWQSTDYFAQATELNPFTHTWSLGVEEQFYLLFPLLFWFTGFGRRGPRGARNLFITVGVLALASLVAFIRLYATNQASAYFLMPTRFWEMAAGCLVFLAYRKRPALERGLERIPPLLVVGAMVAVLCAPLAAAVPATVAIVLLSTILLACLKQGTAAFRLFTQPGVVAIGLISYSLYLWHWGVLSISRWTIGVSWWSALPQLLLMLLLAAASYRWVEQPLRRLRWRQGAMIPILGGVAAAGFSSAGLTLLAQPANAGRLLVVDRNAGGFQQGRLSQGNYIGPTTGRHNIVCQSEARTLSQQVLLNSLAKCLWQNPSQSPNGPVVAFIGDSHAHQLFPLAEKIARSDGFSVYNFQYWGCLVPQLEQKLEGPGCAKVNQVPGWIADVLDRPIIFVVASIADPYLHFPSRKEQRQRASNFEHLFTPLTRQGHGLIVVAPNPKFKTIDNTISDICGRGWWTSLNPVCTADHSFKASEQRRARSTYLKRLNNWSARNARVAIVDPFTILCSKRAGRCHASAEGRANYWDYSHLNEHAVLKTYPLYRDALTRIGPQLTPIERRR